MNIEIKGIGFGNRGAELMLVALITRLRRTFPEMRFAVKTYAGTYEQRARYGLHQMTDGNWNLANLFGGGQRKRCGLLREEEMDVLLDASGYAYGDAWRPQWVENSAKHILRYRKRNKRIILLPQAFGPFENPAVRSASEKILRAADLIYARDAESLKHVLDLVPESGHIAQAPDFTGILAGRLPDTFVADSRRVCVIPNTEMLRCAPDAYLSFLSDCIAQVQNRGYTACILLHEGERDKELAAKLQESSKIPVLDDPDPLHLKGIIGSCAFIIGSRYHGLVSALSQGIPAVGTFWSHKYLYLYEDYGCPDLLMNLQSPKNFAEPVLARLCDSESRRIIHIGLLEKSRIVNAQTEIMWQQVERLLRG